MKKISHLLALCLLASAVLISSCGKSEEEKNLRQQAAELLSSKNWKATQVEWEGMDLMSEDGQYANFVLSFNADAGNADVTGGTFTVQNGGYAFPSAQGTWEYKSGVASLASFDIIRKDADGTAVDITVSGASSGGMTLTFDLPESTTARTNGANGKVAFTLVPAE